MGTGSNLGLSTTYIDEIEIVTSAILYQQFYGKCSIFLLITVALHSSFIRIVMLMGFMI